MRRKGEAIPLQGPGCWWPPLATAQPWAPRVLSDHSRRWRSKRFSQALSSASPRPRGILNGSGSVYLA